MRTSYYAVTPDTTPGAIAISLYPPKGTRYLHYPALCPPKWLLREFKEGYCSEQEYRTVFEQQLAKLDPLVTWNVLHHIAGSEIAGAEPILLCYERSGSFCHRRIVADWFTQQFGIEIPEGFGSKHSEQLSLFGGAS